MSKKMSNYRIRERLVRGFVIAAGIPAVVAVVALIALIVVSNVYSDALENYGFAQGDAGKALTYFAEARSSLRGVIGYDEMSAIENLKVTHDKNVELFKQSFADMERTMVTEANKEIYSNISAELVDYWKLEGEVLELGATTDRAIATQAQNMAINQLMPLFDSIYEQLLEIMEIKVDRGDSLSNTLSASTIILLVAFVSIIVLALFFSIRMGRTIAGGISSPLIQLSDRLESFSKGDLLSPFPTVETKDEVADMVASATDMAQSLDFIISDLEYILGRMADSDYTVRSKDAGRYVGDFEQLFNSARKMRDSMVETMRFIEESAAQVTAGSTNLSETSISLAEGATEQAGAVEELQATITTISETAKKAAISADEAYQQSQKYVEVANNSSDDMKEMVEAMSRINETSQKIGNIISEIESIASQTNLLSLNASIEAARAGEAGRGFSVVADQIRQLAEQSSKSAVDTRTLIEGAMQEIDNGNKVADRAVASLEIVVDGIRKLASASQELSVASTSQADTMKEAEAGVNQISDVIQTNAAVAQESSATSQQLASQATSLDDLISRFELPS